MEYRIVYFNAEGRISVKELEAFMKDAEVVISDFMVAWSKQYVVEVGENHRGAVLELVDGTYVQAYNIHSKLVKY